MGSCSAFLSLHDWLQHSNEHEKPGGSDGAVLRTEGHRFPRWTAGRLIAFLCTGAPVMEWGWVLGRGLPQGLAERAMVGAASTCPQVLLIDPSWDPQTSPAPCIPSEECWVLSLALFDYREFSTLHLQISVFPGPMRPSKVLPVSLPLVISALTQFWESKVSWGEKYCCRWFSHLSAQKSALSGSGSHKIQYQRILPITFKHLFFIWLSKLFTVAIFLRGFVLRKAHWSPARGWNQLAAGTEIVG